MLKRLKSEANHKPKDVNKSGFVLVVETMSQKNGRRKYTRNTNRNAVARLWRVQRVRLF